MTTPRRRVLRPTRSLDVDPRRQRRIANCQAALEKEQAALGRWMAKLKRAFHAVEKSQARMTRLQRQLANLEQGQVIEG